MRKDIADWRERVSREVLLTSSEADFQGAHVVYSALMTASMAGSYIVGRSARTIGKHRKSESEAAVAKPGASKQSRGEGPGMISGCVCRACRAICIDARCAAAGKSIRSEF